MAYGPQQQNDLENWMRQQAAARGGNGAPPQQAGPNPYAGMQFPGMLAPGNPYAGGAPPQRGQQQHQPQGARGQGQQPHYLEMLQRLFGRGGQAQQGQQGQRGQQAPQPQQLPPNFIAQQLAQQQQQQQQANPYARAPQGSPGAAANPAMLNPNLNAQMQQQANAYAPKPTVPAPAPMQPPAANPYAMSQAPAAQAQQALNRTMTPDEIAAQKQRGALGML